MEKRWTEFPRIGNRDYMKIAIDTNVISPHLAPVALELVRQGHSVIYVYHEKDVERCRTSAIASKVDAIARFDPSYDEDTLRALLDADILIEAVRNFDLMRLRLRCGKVVYYTSERWFKPFRIDAPKNSERAKGVGVYVSGFLKMLFPFAIKRALAFMRMMRDGGPFYYLPIGVIAARDMARMCGLMNGDIRCVFRSPRLSFENRPFGKISAEDGNDKRYCLDKMRMWGYFVEPPKDEVKGKLNAGDLRKARRILWVGRFLGWKKVDTLIKAVRGGVDLELDIFGAGPDESRLKKLAAGCGNINFEGMKPLSEIRSQMRSHDIYVLSSNAFEGWGAVVNEALEEGMKVVGTYEAGASATILPPTNLFHAGDWKRLREMLQHPIVKVGILKWTAEEAARAVIGGVKI